MSIRVFASSTRPSQFVVEPNLPEYSLAVNVITAMPSFETVIAYALGRHGFEANDGYYGIAYPTLGRRNDGCGLADIPIKMVQVWEFWGVSDADKRLLFECDYLEVLSQVLRIGKWSAAANEVAFMRNSLES